MNLAWLLVIWLVCGLFAVAGTWRDRPVTTPTAVARAGDPLANCFHRQIQCTGLVAR